MATAETLEVGRIVTELGGGLALFLYGMRRMTDSLKTVAGGRMKDLLARLTANRYSAAIAGALVTAVIQSSSVTTVLVVGFISAGLLNLGQSIGVIIGANVGTTVTAQIIAFQVYKYGLVMIATGFFTEIIVRNERMKHWGRALMGLGLIFFGMQLMSIATGPLRSWSPFIAFMQNMESPLVAIVIGMVFTAIVQSSSATTGIVIVLASQGLMSLETGIGLIFGANIGTCVTAFIAAFGRPREAMQAAWIHVIFNIGGVLLWMFFIPQLADLVRLISPVSAAGGLDKLATETPRQIANAHTIFNVGNALLFIWFTKPMSRFVNWIVPEAPKPVEMKPLYLDDLFLEQPAMAIDQAHREILRMASFDRSLLSETFKVVTVGRQDEITKLAEFGKDIDKLHVAIISYLGKISLRPMVDPQPRQIYRYITIANNLENIGDVVDKALLEVAVKRLRTRFVISTSTLSKLQPIHEQVLIAFDRVVHALQSGERNAAVEAIESKSVINQLADDATAHLTKRLTSTDPNRLTAFKTETDIIEELKRINTFTRRIARAILEFAEDPVPEAAEASSADESA